MSAVHALVDVSLMISSTLISKDGVGREVSVVAICLYSSC